MAKHKRTVVTEFPAWVEKSTDACLRSVAEDAYIAQSLAAAYGAPHSSKCAQLMQAGEKSLKVLANPKASSKIRCAEGDRAARKFWEAKVCARDTKR
jgi:hypothetical protein